MKKIPKIDLHCHLDGSLPLETMERLLGRKVRPEEAQADDQCLSLSEYLEKFALPLQCMQTEEGLKESARDFLLNVAQEGVCYIEVRFAPLFSVHEGLTCRQVLEAVLAGLESGKERCGVPYNVIACAMRHDPQEKNLQMLKDCREFLGEGLCAVDLAGDEAAYPMSGFRELFGQAKRLGLPFTIHAGECGSAQNVREAVECGALRIGHGVAMSGHKEIQKLCADRRIGIEMCPVSNLQTKAVRSPEEYPLREFLDAGLYVTLNTDNRTVSGTSISREMEFARSFCHMEEEELLELQKNAVCAAFASDQVKQELWRLF